MSKTVLFDLDGTLLPMDQDLFVKTYFKRLAEKVAPLGYEPHALTDGIWEGTAAMVKNDGADTNDVVFWRTFAARFGQRVYADLPVFDDFYRNEFGLAKSVCGFNPAANDLLKALKEKGAGLVLASNPVFPRIAQESRMRWAGVDPNDFLYLTSYENSRFCKPNPRYYTEIAQTLSLSPQDCIMVGNDYTEDGAARKAGMKVFLLVDCLIAPPDASLDAFPHGDYAALAEFLFGELDETPKNA